MKKSLLINAGLAMAAAGVMAITTSTDVSAHGYIQQPISRSYQASLEKSTLGWQGAFNKYGKVIDDPQSLEAEKGYPEKGPADGKIASADGAVGDFIMDTQTATFWKKQTISTGTNNFTWNYTATHPTSKWTYYITKNGWNPDRPLTRDSFEKIGTISGEGQQANRRPTHQVTIPSNRVGYHVILAVWDVDDTDNAFYNVIDANIVPRTVLSDLEQ
ncbi:MULTISPECIES: lytic polysaccharide monooxygenase [unclassified Enterococcus]|jgi:predicted carbohydrate-binding protein with CBM5 and CBM33 domain|uniref:lytic polysaccharide monooxygenase n=1 Tax=unclassified Enterococcus TaxID=2608891 RepID=UPI003D2A951E